MSAPLRIAVHGAAGRMGRRVIALADADKNIEVIAAIEHDQHSLLGTDAGEIAGIGKIDVPLSSKWPSDADVVIDFSLPEAMDRCIDKCIAHETSLVVATTGMTDEQIERLREASSSIPIVWAPSMSLAVNLSMKVAQQITEKLMGVPGGLDVEIIERHHRFKADAPSGTALKFGDMIAEKLGDDTKHVHGREGHTGQRTRNEIGYHAVRVGDNPGEHTIVFGMLGERIELNVAASNRDCYAGGAVAAAKWLTGKSAGMYDMFDVLEM
ncbi:4-hydroxy-tetrahydrodipicolinate reductase [Rhodopirellula sp. MGV]|uniref:4-hydroxy-tetrahydrodipicolinate reductase n=1 Tax=Rhodopirellula sp. MGV TaxID=2023130 RepID=UPI000B97B5CA|nr:4-hydroxy-tetrahydrodipicolinate reductase [Rhodopirellula sp. MGV]OYP29796.1 4-hydroxy-tetrahydrodipicolinate reductase [Rhodopirellula sp. MGV]PNY33681.1 4-hydroxy-tetrahydrodipicolinate reductase [Rhodopirellula baltica]